MDTVKSALLLLWLIVWLPVVLLGFLGRSMQFAWRLGWNAADSLFVFASDPSTIRPLKDVAFPRR